LASGGAIAGRRPAARVLATTHVAAAPYNASAHHARQAGAGITTANPVPASFHTPAPLQGRNPEAIRAVRQSAVTHPPFAAALDPVGFEALQFVPETHPFRCCKAEGGKLNLQRAQVRGQLQGQGALYRPRRPLRPARGRRPARLARRGRGGGRSPGLPRAERWRRWLRLQSARSNVTTPAAVANQNRPSGDFKARGQP